MSILDIHADALKGTSEAYHVFLQHFSKNSRVVYGVVEGYDDASFYKPFIDTLIPDTWELRIINAKNKDNVYALHKEIDWRRFPKRRVCFFVDRDLSDLIPEVRHTDTNIYISRHYSIENELATPYAVRRILTELSGFDAASVEDLDNLIDIFKIQSSLFYDALVDVMSWVLLTRRTTASSNLANIEMRRIFKIYRGQISQRLEPGGYESLEKYLENRLGMPTPAETELSAARALFHEGDNKERFARGKYVLWFVFEFCNSVKSGANELCTSIKKTRTGFANLSVKNGLPAAAGKARLPPCLRTFINENYIKFAVR